MKKTVRSLSVQPMRHANIWRRRWTQKRGCQLNSETMMVRQMTSVVTAHSSFSDAYRTAANVGLDATAVNNVDAELTLTVSLSCKNSGVKLNKKNIPVYWIDGTIVGGKETEDGQSLLYVSTQLHWRLVWHNQHQQRRQTMSCQSTTDASVLECQCVTAFTSHITITCCTYLPSWLWRYV